MYSTMSNATDSGELRISHLSYDNRSNVKFEHDRLNRSQVPWKLCNLCRRVLFFLRNLSVTEYSGAEFPGFPLRNSDAFVVLIQQSFVIAARFPDDKSPTLYASIQVLFI